MKWILMALVIVVTLSACPTFEDGIVVVKKPTTDTNSNSTSLFAVFSETLPMEVIWDTDIKMDVWNDGWNSGGCTLSDDSTTKVEGTNSLKIVGIAGKSWFGVAMRVEPITNFKDMTSYSNSVLKFWFKSSYNVTKVGIKSEGIERWITGITCMSYGLKTNDTWSEVSIPMSAFTGINFAKIEQYFMIVADGAYYTTGRVWNLDLVYYTNY